MFGRMPISYYLAILGVQKNLESIVSEMFRPSLCLVVLQARSLLAGRAQTGPFANCDAL